jgi:uncharacterized C2H2 Zn-finger protein
MPTIKLRCPHCGEEETTQSPCPYTGWMYSEGWVVKCPRCNANMEERKETAVVQRHVCECEKVLRANECDS